VQAPAAPVWVLTTPPAPLWPHQQEAVQVALERRGFMVAVPMGGGKTKIAIEIAQRANARRALILCPRSVVDVWPTQLTEHAATPWVTWAGEVAGKRGPLRNATTARKAGALRQRLAMAGDRPFAAIVNYEASIQTAMADCLLDIEWDLVVLDESHRLKAAGGKQSKLAHRICRRTRMYGGRALALTGTPMPHSPLDIYAQYRAIDDSVLGTSHAAFRARYGAPKVLRVTDQGEAIYLRGPAGQPIYDGVRADRLGELTQRIALLMFQVDQAALDRTLGLADPVDQHRTVHLEAPTERIYYELEKHLIADIDGGVVTAANAMVNVLRLAQAANGFAVDADTGATRQILPAPEKTRLLADVLDDLPVDEPVVVFCRFHHDLDQVKAVCETQGRRYGELSGRARDGMTDHATMSPGIDVLGAQLKSGGVGVDLTRARHAIYFSLDFSLGDYLQSRKRLHRPGQQRRVVYTHLLAAGTIDHAIYGALRRRQEVIGAVLTQLSQAAHGDRGEPGAGTVTPFETDGLRKTSGRCS
jgi:superfamily II DNA or RNA helicase